MENVVKRAVEEYMAQREAKNEDMPQKSNNKQQQRQENRLSGLLTKIRSKSNTSSAPKQKNNKRLQIKWYRYNDHSYQLVRVNQGGGCRFVEVDEDSTFKDIKCKATDLFFDDSFKNAYGENVLDCTISFCDATLNELDETSNIFEYVRKKGFQLSKTFFVLKSEHHYDSDTENEALCDYSVGTKRRICLKCGCTYVNDCHICIQNGELNDSLTNDQMEKEQSYNEPVFDTYDLFDDLPRVLSGMTSNDLVESANTSNKVQDSNEEETEEDHIVSPEQLRELRVEHFRKRQHIIRIHRIKVSSDLVKYFIENKVDVNDEINYIFIDPRGKEEIGVGSGVTRDVYSAFWQEASNSYLIGELERVPFVRHDMYKAEWSAIGMIITKGYLDIGYFPTILSRCFINYCMFGSVTDEELIESFKKYLSPDECALISKILSLDLIEDLDENEDLQDFLDVFKCRTIVSKDNINIMASCWKDSFMELKKEFCDSSVVKCLYNKMEPTTKRVISMLDANPVKEAQKESFAYFKRYIKGLSMVELKKLLKFLTGSDLIIVEKIEVAFNSNISEFERRPIAHTCAPMLELPATYNNFCELREEFANILSESTWEMNII